MVRIHVIAFIACLWGAMFYAALSIAKLDLGYVKSICGPWGCLAGVAPLLSVHCMWLVLIGGGLSLARWAQQPLRPRKLWVIGAISGFGLIMILWGTEYFHYTENGGQFSAAMDHLKFLAFHALQWTDIPAIEFALTTSVHALIRGKICD